MLLPPYTEMTPNATWLLIVDDILGIDPVVRDAARRQMSNEVGFYVERVLLLPMGSRAEDPGARRDIAVRVLAKLEDHDFQQLKEWRCRQRRQRDHASWWGWIRTIAYGIAIDFARECEENVASSANPVEYAKTEPEGGRC